MKSFPVILLTSLVVGFASIKAFDNKKPSSFTEKQTEETVTVEEILEAIKESAISFNHSLHYLTVKQTTVFKSTYNSTLMGEVKIVKQILFKHPDIIEQKVIEKEEKVNNGINIMLEEAVPYTLFTMPFLSSLSTDDYDINLVGSKIIKGHSAYLLEVKPKNKQEEFIDGKLWIDTIDFIPFRFEGKPSKKGGKSKEIVESQIVEYEKIDDEYWLPIFNRRESGMMMMNLENEITYSQYEINNEGSK